MILEVADIRIAPGQQAAFDEAIQRGIATVISRARGFSGWKVNKGVESPERYLLMIFWDTLGGPHRGLPPGSAVRRNGARSSGPSSRRRRTSSISRCSASRPEPAGFTRAGGQAHQRRAGPHRARHRDAPVVLRVLSRPRS